MAAWFSQQSDGRMTGR